MLGIQRKRESREAWRLRWARTDDMAAVTKIETASFEFPWTQEELQSALLSAGVFFKVGVVYGQIAGYTIWRQRRNGLHLENIAVATGFRQMGIGRQMIAHLQNKLRIAPPKWRCLTTMVDEYNADAIAFMHAVGLRALGVEREPYQQKGRDGIVFEWERESETVRADDQRECCGR